MRLVLFESRLDLTLDLNTKILNAAKYLLKITPNLFEQNQALSLVL